MTQTFTLASPHRVGARLGEWLGIAAILVITGLTAYGSMDLLLWDETGYLARGVDPDRFSRPGWEDSFSYSGMYWLLSLMISDPVDSYFVGRTLSSVLVVLGVFVAARLNSGPLPSLAAAGVMAVLPVTYVWPGVAGPAAAALVVSAGLVWRVQQPWVLGVAAMLTWVAAASRPEFTWVAVVLSGWVVAWQISLIGSRGLAKKPWQLLLSGVGGIVFPVAVFTLFGNVLQSSPRQWTAFVQHFALRNASADQDVWVSADRIAQSFFPTSGSVAQALAENPGAVVEHVFANSLWLPVTLVGHIAGFGGQPVSLRLSVGVAGSFLFGVVIAAYRNRRSGRFLVLRGFTHHRVAIALVAILLGGFAIPAGAH